MIGQFHIGAIRWSPGVSVDGVESHYDYSDDVTFGTAMSVDGRVVIVNSGDWLILSDIPKRFFVLPDSVFIRIASGD